MLDKNNTSTQQTQQPPKPNKINKHQLKSNIIIATVTSVFLVAIALGLQYVHVNIPACPSHIAKSFTLSLIPEILGSLAFGPIVGTLIIGAKLVIYFFIEHTLKITLIDNLILDGSMVFFSGTLYHLQKRRFQKMRIHRSNHRKWSQLISSVIGAAIISSVVIFLARYYLIYPFMIEKIGISPDQIMNTYKNMDENIKSLAEGVVLYDAGILSLKNIIFGIASVIIYKYVTPLLHRI